MTSIENLDYLFERIEIDFLLNEPFYASVFRRMKRISSVPILTCAVCLYQQEVLFLYNPHFIAGLEYEQFKGVCIHEILHICFLHIPRCNNADLNRHFHNIASDLAIDQKIEHLLGDITLTIEGVFQKYAPEIEYDRETEYYYHELLDKSGLKHLDTLSTLDNHDPWTMTEDQIRELYLEEEKKAPVTLVLGLAASGIEQEIQKYLSYSSEGILLIHRDIIDKALKDAGNILPSALPDDYLRIVFTDDSFEFKEKWNKIFQQYVHNHLLKNSFKHYELTRTKRRPNKKLGFPFPSLKITPISRLHIAVCIDGSYSIDDITFQEFMHEVNCMYDREIEITLIGFDAEVSENNIIRNYNPYKWINRELKAFSLFPDSLGGGTCFQPPLEAAVSLSPAPDCIVFYTDSYNFDEIDEPEIPLLFVLTEKREDFYAWAHCIHMEEVQANSFVSLYSSG